MCSRNQPEWKSSLTSYCAPQPGRIFSAHYSGTVHAAFETSQASAVPPREHDERSISKNCGRTSQAKPEGNCHEFMRQLCRD